MFNSDWKKIFFCIHTLSYNWNQIWIPLNQTTQVYKYNIVITQNTKNSKTWCYNGHTDILEEKTTFLHAFLSWFNKLLECRVIKSVVFWSSHILSTFLFSSLFIYLLNIQFCLWSGGINHFQRYFHSINAINSFK